MHSMSKPTAAYIMRCHLRDIRPTIIRTPSDRKNHSQFSSAASSDIIPPRQNIADIIHAAVETFIYSGHWSVSVRDSSGFTVRSTRTVS